MKCQMPKCKQGVFYVVWDLNYLQALKNFQALNRSFFLCTCVTQQDQFLKLVIVGNNV